jgi:hypothetical protein
VANLTSYIIHLGRAVVVSGVRCSVLLAMHKRAALQLLVLIALVNQATAFHSGAHFRQNKHAGVTPHHADSFAQFRDRPCTSWSSSIFRMSANDDDISGTKRGIPILVLVLLGNLWCFTIPPEFRRAHICPTPSCVESRQSCYDCRTLNELRAGIADYYRGGGGIKWDFSIDPSTKVDFFK